MSPNKNAPLGGGASAVALNRGPASYPASPSDSRPDRPEWTAAKSAGDEGEKRVANFFRSLGLLVKQQTGYAPFDLEVRGRIEVKTDLRAAHTGNVAVEVQYRGRLSGINASTATGWCFVVGEELLLCPIAALRELLRNRNYRRAQAGESAIVALVPLADLRRISRSLREVTP